jgi:hypothetical protein
MDGDVDMADRTGQIKQADYASPPVFEGSLRQNITLRRDFLKKRAQPGLTS